MARKVHAVGAILKTITDKSWRFADTQIVPRGRPEAWLAAKSTQARQKKKQQFERLTRKLVILLIPRNYGV